MVKKKSQAFETYKKIVKYSETRNKFENIPLNCFFSEIFGM